MNLFNFEKKPFGILQINCCWDNCFRIVFFSPVFKAPGEVTPVLTDTEMTRGYRFFSKKKT